MLISVPVGTPCFVKIWVYARPIIFVVLCLLPFSIYEWQELITLWPIPTMAVVAASIPASGAPVAGGIVFLPVLHSFGVCPRDAVAFSAATQFFGVGIFAPLNWMAQDASVFLPGALCSFYPLPWMPRFTNHNIWTVQPSQHMDCAALMLPIF